MYAVSDVHQVLTRLNTQAGMVSTVYKETTDIFDDVSCERLRVFIDTTSCQRTLVSQADLHRITGMTSQNIQALHRFAIDGNASAQIYLCKYSASDEASSIVRFDSRKDGSELLYVLLCDPAEFTGGRIVLMMAGGEYAPFRKQGESLAFASCIPHGMMRLTSGNKYELCIETFKNADFVSSPGTTANTAGSV